MTQAAKIIDIIGGVRKTSKLLSAPLTTVQSWRDGGFIPARRQDAVLAAARAAGIDLKPDDFFSVADAFASVEVAA